LGLQALAQKGRRSDFTFHFLKNTCATLVRSKNVNIKIASEMLGHATISQTMDTYSRVVPTIQEHAAAAMESIFL
jgi:integrase